MPVVFASGCVGRPLIAVKGKSIKFRVVKSNNASVVKTIADCLPEGSLVTCRDDVAGSDSNSISEWAKEFVKDNEYKLSQGKILLLMDGYRSHMRYKTLSFLHSANVIAYALPAHTSGVTQPLDVSVFGVSKSKLRDLVDGMPTAGAVNVYDQFDILKLVTAAYGKAFTRSNIASGFSKSGIYPANLSYVFAQPCPFSSSQCDKTMNAEDIERILEAK